MKPFITVIALGAVLALGTVAGAKQKSHDDKATKGKVTAITKEADGKTTDITVTAGHKNDKHDVVIKADANTKVTKDGQAATLADVSAGEHVAVTEGADGKALSIEIHTAHHKKAAGATANTAK